MLRRKARCDAVGHVLDATCEEIGAVHQDVGALGVVKVFSANDAGNGAGTVGRSSLVLHLRGFYVIVDDVGCVAFLQKFDPLDPLGDSLVEFGELLVMRFDGIQPFASQGEDGGSRAVDFFDVDLVLQGRYQTLSVLHQPFEGWDIACQLRLPRDVRAIGLVEELDESVVGSVLLGDVLNVDGIITCVRLGQENVTLQDEPFEFLEDVVHGKAEDGVGCDDGGHEAVGFRRDVSDGESLDGVSHFDGFAV
mmetsp:Transcript_23855/g.66650  ORF Transcript_23855/g.66650 Transcript_23855/m.66650 type:complete len:250 (-) Transcript_23855:170-919(-)